MVSASQQTSGRTLAGGTGDAGAREPDERPHRGEKSGRRLSEDGERTISILE